MCCIGRGSIDEVASVQGWHLSKMLKEAMRKHMGIWRKAFQAEEQQMQRRMKEG